MQPLSFAAFALQPVNDGRKLVQLSGIAKFGCQAVVECVDLRLVSRFESWINLHDHLMWTEEVMVGSDTNLTFRLLGDQT